jgi:hypothetical protein
MSNSKFYLHIFLPGEEWKHKQKSGAILETVLSIPRISISRGLFAGKD